MSKRKRGRRRKNRAGNKVKVPYEVRVWINESSMTVTGGVRSTGADRERGRKPKDLG